jgi:hypothetical protein
MPVEEEEEEEEVCHPNIMFNSLLNTGIEKIYNMLYTSV